MRYFIGIDLGGTNIKAGVVDEDGNILASENCPTQIPRAGEKICDSMIAVSRKALQQMNLTLKDVCAIGIGTPGTVNPETGMLIYANNLYLQNFPMAPYISQKTGLPVFINNDANVAALGEARAGSAKGSKFAVMVTLGTGVGTGVIIDSKIYAGFNYAGGEIGHTVIVKGGRPCTCGRKGCWEAYASATGLINLTKEAMQGNPQSALWQFAPTFEQAGGRTAFQAAAQGDAAGAQVVEEYLDYLACGITNIINALQPQVVCLGGGVSKEGEIILAPLRKRVYAEIYGGANTPQTQIVAATLGNNAGIVGAAMLAL